ncbi:AAA family ATPase [Sphingobacterium kyonggiense]
MKNSLKEKYLEKSTCLDLSMISIIFDKEMEMFSPFMLFCHFFDCIPNTEECYDICCAKSAQWIKNNYKEEIIKQFVNRASYKERPFSRTYLNILLHDSILVHLDFTRDKVVIFYREDREHVVNYIWKNIWIFRESNNQKHANISLIISDEGNLFTKTFHLHPSNVDLELHYNDDFLEVHQVILERLTQENDLGIVLLHGLPGTGKTNYLRYLFTLVSKEVIFLPVEIAAKLSNFEMLTFLLNHKNSIIVIEDAENLVINRNVGGSSVASLLNIADGLLSDCLGIQFICTFNTDLSSIDKALLRKGRLIAKYYFGPLKLAKARNLSESLGNSKILKKDTVLTDIFHQDQEIGMHSEQTGESLGFSINS